MSDSFLTPRMDLTEVQEWLTEQGFGELAEAMEKFRDHTWTVNGRLRADVIQECLPALVWRYLTAEVTTYIEETPLHLAFLN